MYKQRAQTRNSIRDILRGYIGCGNGTHITEDDAITQIIKICKPQIDENLLSSKIVNWLETKGNTKGLVQNLSENSGEWLK